VAKQLSSTPIIQAIQGILRDSLQLGERASLLTAESRLFGVIPELDSMTIVTVLTMIEEEFGIDIYDDEITAEVFSTVGSLSDFVRGKVAD